MSLQIEGQGRAGQGRAGQGRAGQGRAGLLKCSYMSFDQLAEFPGSFGCGSITNPLPSPCCNS